MCLCVYCGVWVRVGCIGLHRMLVYFIVMHTEDELQAYLDPVLIPS